ncbi:NADPH-dependent F420 reductase [Polaromonas sp. UC242_47]|uniref:NADPH-dependent F420 reductase n=1 Tax=Polaromonas sp. UC242_47 TaxID=3374626 RepID=UPI0037BDE8E7
MKIGVVGAGGIGQAFAGHAAKAGYEVILSNSRDPESLSAAAREMGPNARAGTREEAAAADVVFLAVQWPQMPEALAGLPAWNGRILIDATNAVGPGFSAFNLNGKSSSEVVASHAPGARVVKAGNTLVRAMLAADPHVAGGRRVLFLCGDDSAAKQAVGDILGRCGFATIDLGALASGSPLQQFPGGVLPTLNLVKLG